MISRIKEEGKGHGGGGGGGVSEGEVAGEGEAVFTSGGRGTRDEE